MTRHNYATDSRLDALYAKVPTFECITGCHACCGAIPFPAEEWARVPVKRATRGKPATAGKRCPYVLDTARCEIYEVRPFMCRIFGTFAGVRCRYGCGPAELLTHKEMGVLLAEYRAIVGGDLGLHACRAQESLARRGDRRRSACAVEACRG